MARKIPDDIEPIITPRVVFVGCLVFIIALIIAIFTTWAFTKLPARLGL